MLKADRNSFYRDILRIIFYEEQKIEKLKMIYRGYKDYKKNIYGEYIGK